MAVKVPPYIVTYLAELKLKQMEINIFKDHIHSYFEDEMGQLENKEEIRIIINELLEDILKNPDLEDNVSYTRLSFEKILADINVKLIEQNGIIK